MVATLEIVVLSFLAVIVYFVVNSISLIKAFRNKRKIKVLRELLKVAFILYLIIVAVVTVSPNSMGGDFDKEMVSRYFNYIPFGDVLKLLGEIETAYDGDVLFTLGLIVRNVGGNIVMFMPLGFLLPLLWQRFRSLKACFLAGFFISILIECVQFIEIITGNSSRTVDIDDVICNATGAIIGYGTYLLATKIDKHLPFQLLGKITVKQENLS